jgi:hypothetical protein
LGWLASGFAGAGFTAAGFTSGAPCAACPSVVLAPNDITEPINTPVQTAMRMAPPPVVQRLMLTTTSRAVCF